MEFLLIPLSDLEVSKQNMRHNAKAPDVSNIMPSIRKLGIMQPLTVRKTENGFEIVAGRRRYHSLLEIAALDKTDAKTVNVPCVIMELGDDAVALEASLVENIARVDPDLMSRFETFTKIVAQGKTIADIAETFGVTEIMVKRSLALGNLIPAIRQLFQADEIDMETIRLLTLASVTQQKKWLKFKKKDDEPQTWMLKQWLFDGELKLSHALFPIADYKGQVVTDLFEEDGYFTNPKKFWALQNKCIAELRENHIMSGWDEVVILETGKRFYEYGHTEMLKKDGGRVYIEICMSGEVTEYKGFITNEEYERRVRKLENKDIKATPMSKPELTKAAQNYVALHRHNAVRVSLFSHANMALRLMVAHTICGSSHWLISPAPQRADKEETKFSIQDSVAQKAFTIEFEEICILMNWLSEDGLPMKPEKYKLEIIEVLQTLQTLSDKDVMRVLTFVMAETLASATPLVEWLGNEFNINMQDYWQPEGVFFDLIRDKNAINAMLADVGGQNVADGNITSTAKIQKGIINNCLTGEGRTQVNDWMPNYMKFPFQSYTKSGAGDLTELANYAETLAQ